MAARANICFSALLFPLNIILKCDFVFYCALNKEKNLFLQQSFYRENASVLEPNCAVWRAPICSLLYLNRLTNIKSPHTVLCFNALFLSFFYDCIKKVKPICFKSRHKEYLSVWGNLFITQPPYSFIFRLDFFQWSIYPDFFFFNMHLYWGFAGIFRHYVSGHLISFCSDTDPCPRGLTISQ